MAGYAAAVIPTVYQESIIDGGATETAILTLDGVNTPGDGADVVLHGFVAGLAGAGATEVLLRVYQDEFKVGNQVGQSAGELVTASNEFTIPIVVRQSGVNAAGKTYVVTITETSATGSGTVTAALGGLVY